MIPSKQSGPQNFTGATKVTVAILVLIVLATILGSGGRSSTKFSSSTSSSAEQVAPVSSTPNAEAFVTGSSAYMDTHERQLYEQDPSSRGYTDADREFLSSHAGHSTAAMPIFYQRFSLRAIETPSKKA